MARKIIQSSEITAQASDVFGSVNKEIRWEDDYTFIRNKPSINGIELIGNKTSEDLGIVSYDDTELRTRIGQCEDNVSILQEQATSQDIKIESLHESLITEQSNRSEADANLQGQINDLRARGRYLSNWNAVNGLPATDPFAETVGEYTYKTGDYYIVGTVGETNYRPNGHSYTTGMSSTEVEESAVAVNDTYIYDGDKWILQNNAQKEISFGSLAGSPDDNIALLNKFNTKATDSEVVHNTGEESISGTKTFSGLIKANGKISSDSNVGIRPSNQNYDVFNFSNTEFLTWKPIRPAINSELTLGTAGSRWKDLYLGGKLSDGTNNITVADICDKSKVVANPGSAATDLTSIAIDGTNYTIKSVDIDVSPYKANSPIIKGISLNGVDYNIMPRDSHGSIIIGPASYVEGAYDNIIALTDNIGNFYNHDGSIYLGNNIDGGTGNTTAHQIIVGANAATKTAAGDAIEGIVIGDGGIAGNADTISIGHGTINYLANTVSFDTTTTSRSIQLESPHNIIFRGAKVSSSKTSVESYTDARYLDDLLPPAPTVAVANKYLKANSTGSGFEYAEIALPTNAVTTDEIQTITGIKKFVGSNRVVISSGSTAGYNYSMLSDSQLGALVLTYQQYSATSWSQLLSITQNIVAPGNTNTMNLGGNVNGTYYYWNNLYINGSIKRNTTRGTQQESVTITLPENSGQMVVAPVPTIADAAKVIRVNSTGTGFEFVEGSSGTLDPETVCQAIENMTSAQKDRVKTALGFVSGDEREY